MAVLASLSRRFLLVSTVGKSATVKKVLACSKKDEKSHTTLENISGDEKRVAEKNNRVNATSAVLVWLTRETGPDIKPLICTTAFISKCKVLE